MYGKFVTVCFIAALPGFIALPLAATAAADDLLGVYQQAHKADPAWLAATAGNRAMQEIIIQTRAGILPVASLAGATTRNSGEPERPGNDNHRRTYNSNSWSVTLTQPLFNAAAWASRKQAMAGVRQSDAQLVASEQDLMVRTAQAYLNILSAEAQLVSAQAEKKAVARQLDHAKRRFEVGLIAITNVHEAQASHDLATANNIGAENRLALARDALSEITGQPHEQLDAVRDDMPLAGPVPEDIDYWIGEAEKGNPELIAATAAATAAQQHVRVQQAGHYPTLSLVASREHKSSQADTGPDDTDSSTLGLRLSLPIYAGGSVSSEVREALAELEQARYHLQRMRRAVVRQTRNAYLGVMNEMSRIKALQQAVVSAQSAVNATEAGFEVGTRTIVDVLSAYHSLHRSRADYEQARHAYLLNGLKLKQATGSLSLDDVAAVNNLLSPR